MIEFFVRFQSEKLRKIMYHGLSNFKNTDSRKKVSCKKKLQSMPFFVTNFFILQIKEFYNYLLHQNIKLTVFKLFSLENALLISVIIFKYLFINCLHVTCLVYLKKYLF